MRYLRLVKSKQQPKRLKGRAISVHLFRYRFPLNTGHGLGTDEVGGGTDYSKLKEGQEPTQ